MFVDLAAPSWPSVPTLRGFFIRFRELVSRVAWARV